MVDVETGARPQRPVPPRSFCWRVHIDFPSISAEWGGAFGGAPNTMTTGGGVKMCGLTGIYGAFNVNSYSNGVSLNAPSTQNGNWTMTISANKFASADCVQ